MQNTSVDISNLRVGCGCLKNVYVVSGPSEFGSYFIWKQIASANDVVGGR